MEERQSRLSSMAWKNWNPYFCARLILQNSMFSNFCHVVKKVHDKNLGIHQKLVIFPFQD